MSVRLFDGRLAVGRRKNRRQCSRVTARDRDPERASVDLAAGGARQITPCCSIINGMVLVVKNIDKPRHTYRGTFYSNNGTIEP